MTQHIPETEQKANLSVSVVLGDITRVKVDAIATIIRPDLEITGSLNKSIFREAGPELDDFILENIIEPREYDTFIVPGFQLPAEQIIFSVLPIWRTDLDIIDKHLHNAVRGIMEVARQSNVTSLALPLLCCGKKGYPLSRGIRLILQGVSERLGPPITHINFTCNDREAVDIYKKRLDI